MYKRTNGLVIACDTVIFCDNKILEKPKDLNEAFEMLKNLSGKTSSAYTGVTIMVDDKVNTFYESLVGFSLTPGTMVGAMVTLLRY